MYIIDQFAIIAIVSWKMYSVLMIVLGMVYIIRPTIFRVGIWKQTDILQRNLTFKQYNIFMRVAGVVLILIGLYVIAKNNYLF